MSDKFRLFLTEQKQRLLALDGASPDNGNLTLRESQGRDFVFTNHETGEKRGLMDMLYENTIDWIGSMRRKTGRMSLNEQGRPVPLAEDTVSTAIAAFVTSLLPAVRRIYTNLIAMDLVSVQPLPGPSGYVYWLDHLYSQTYSDAEDTITADDRLDQKHPIDYAAGAEKAAIRKIQFRLQSKLISTITQKLEADWTIEAEQDLRSQWKLDLESELIPQLTNECIRETDRRLIAAMLAGAAYNVNWNENGYLAGDTATYEREAYKEQIYKTAIVNANAYIFSKKYMNGNWLIMNGDTYTKFQRLNNFVADPMAINQQASIGRVFVGTLAGLYKVYVDPWFTANKILMGIRGASWQDAVAYYSPYIPLFISDKYLIADDFTQFARGAMSRYAYGVLPESSTQSPVQNNGLVTITITQS